MSSSDPAEVPLFKERLHPHRSMTPGQVRWLLAVVAVGGCISSVPFVLMGAWPVAGFFGLDVLIVSLAFKASFRAARAYEDICVTPLELQLDKVSPTGVRREWRFNPVWVKLDRHVHEEFGVQRLDLISRGHRVELASFLGPDAKAQLADGLTSALHQARRGVRYS
jgi:uncharacterized membrane protein